MQRVVPIDLAVAAVVLMLLLLLFLLLLLLLFCGLVVSGLCNTHIEFEMPSTIQLQLARLSWTWVQPLPTNGNFSMPETGLHSVASTICNEKDRRKPHVQTYAITSSLNDKYSYWCGCCCCSISVVVVVLLLLLLVVSMSPAPSNKMTTSACLRLACTVWPQRFAMKRIEGNHMCKHTQ